nr:uncharacterized protein LOC105483932 [Macaca nemestrina]
MCVRARVHASAKLVWIRQEFSPDAGARELIHQKAVHGLSEGDKGGKFLRLIPTLTIRDARFIPLRSNSVLWDPTALQALLRVLYTAYTAFHSVLAAHEEWLYHFAFPDQSVKAPEAPRPHQPTVLSVLIMLTILPVNMMNYTDSVSNVQPSLYSRVAEKGLGHEVPEKRWLSFLPSFLYRVPRGVRHDWVPLEEFGVAHTEPPGIHQLQFRFPCPGTSS